MQFLKMKTCQWSVHMCGAVIALSSLLLGGCDEKHHTPSPAYRYYTVNQSPFPENFIQVDVMNCFPNDIITCRIVGGNVYDLFDRPFPIASVPASGQCTGFNNLSLFVYVNNCLVAGEDVVAADVACTNDTLRQSLQTQNVPISFPCFS